MEDIFKNLENKSNRYEEQIKRGLSYNDDEYEAFYTLNFIKDLQTKLSNKEAIIEEAKEQNKINVVDYESGRINYDNFRKITTILDKGVK